MTSKKKLLSAAIGKILDPLVHLLLKNDISHSEFSELARRSYVKMAFQYFTIPGRKKTNSRVSVITGLSRQEVIRIRALEEDAEPVTKGPLNRATQVIGGWLQDPEFVDQNKRPKELPLKGEKSSFEALVSRYSGGIFPRSILDELIRVGTVSIIDKDKVKLNYDGYVPNNSEAEYIEMVSRHAGDLLGTIVHNFATKAEERRFQRQVSYTDIPDSIDKEFRMLCYEKSLTMLVELNQWLAEKKKTAKLSPDEPRTRVGLGIYYFKNEIDEDKS